MAAPPDFTALMQQQSAWLGLDIAPEHQPGVVRYLELASGIAQAVLAHPLSPLDEPAPVFVPVAAQEPS
jgi:hypothetical protein